MKLMHDRSKKGAEKVGSAPFGTGGNVRVFSHGKGVHSSPAGDQTQYKDESRKGTLKNRK